MRVARFAIALLATPLLLTLHAETASAAPPSNDTFAGATPVTLGFSEELDTSEATTDADDVQLKRRGLRGRPGRQCVVRVHDPG
jgi:hypothetical protein